MIACTTEYVGEEDTTFALGEEFPPEPTSDMGGGEEDDPIIVPPDGSGTFGAF